MGVPFLTTAHCYFVATTKPEKVLKSNLDITHQHPAHPNYEVHSDTVQLLSISVEHQSLAPCILPMLFLRAKQMPDHLMTGFYD